jgi:nicotinamidase-related amidase
MVKTAAGSDLHGNVPDESPVALLIVDMINDLEFDGGEKLLQSALPAAGKLSHLKTRAKKLKIPVIYVNDNFGRWQSNFEKQLEHCLMDGVRGEPVVKLIRPEHDDYFVLKPKHSAFFSTTLETLLNHLKAKTLILTGLTGDVCIMFTAQDAYLRDYKIIVPRDCVASIDDRENEYALNQMARVMKADISPSTEIDLNALVADRG